MSTLLSLPDEILLLIFESLNSLDKISISQTCSRLSNVIDEKSLISSVNLNAAYTLKGTDLKCFFRSKLRCSLITVLDITSCYWLVPSDIIPCVVKLKQLTALHAADTQLSFVHLKKLLPTLKLERLSISGTPAKADDIVQISSKLAALKYLFVSITIDVYGLALANLTYWLEHCRQLQEFWLVCQMTDKSEMAASILNTMPDCSTNVHFPDLHTFVVEKPELGLYRFPYDAIWGNFINSLIGNKIENQWKIVWLNGEAFFFHIDMSDCEAFFTYATIMRQFEYPNLKHLVLFSNSYAHVNIGIDQVPRLENLCICSSSTEPPQQYPRLVEFIGLHSLALFELRTLGDTWFKTIGQLHNLRSLSFIKCRFSISMSDRSSAIESFEALTKSLTQLRKFELRALLEPSTREWEFWDQILPLISNFSQLTKLSLVDLMILEQTFMAKIAVSCPDIESINLTHLGSKGLDKVVPVLCKALPNCKKLKDFRFQQSNVELCRHLLESLKYCPALEKVVIIDNGVATNSTTFSNITNVVTLFKTCTRLVFFYFQSITMPVRWRKAVLTAAQHLHQEGTIHPNLKLYLVRDEPTPVVPWIHRSVLNPHKPLSLQGAPGTWYFPQIKFS